MEASIKKTESTGNIRYVEIIIGDNLYRLTESVDGKLCVNKSDGNDSALMIFPRQSNEIELK